MPVRFLVKREKETVDAMNDEDVWCQETFWPDFAIDIGLRPLKRCSQGRKPSRGRAACTCDRISMSEYAIDHNGNSLVADTVLLTGAVTRQVADLAAVVALLSLGAVTGEMAWRIHQQIELSKTTRDIVP
jgi:hypothetical protein